MADRTLLSDHDIEAALEGLTGWERDGDTIRASFTFADFSEAFGFMARVALAAEKADHHPDWSNVWNTVEVAFTTHDAGGITALDIDLARKVSSFS